MCYIKKKPAFHECRVYYEIYQLTEKLKLNLKFVYWQ